MAMICLAKSGRQGTEIIVSQEANEAFLREKAQEELPQSLI